MIHKRISRDASCRFQSETQFQNHYTTMILNHLLTFVFFAKFADRGHTLHKKTVDKTKHYTGSSTFLAEKSRKEKQTYVSFVPPHSRLYHKPQNQTMKGSKFDHSHQFHSVGYESSASPPCRRRYSPQGYSMLQSTCKRNVLLVNLENLYRGELINLSRNLLPNRFMTSIKILNSRMSFFKPQ